MNPFFDGRTPAATQGFKFLLRAPDSFSPALLGVELPELRTQSPEAGHSDDRARTALQRPRDTHQGSDGDVESPALDVLVAAPRQSGALRGLLLREFCGEPCLPHAAPDLFERSSDRASKGRVLGVVCHRPEEARSHRRRTRPYNKMACTGLCDTGGVLILNRWLASWAPLAFLVAVGACAHIEESTTVDKTTRVERTRRVLDPGTFYAAEGAAEPGGYGLVVAVTKGQKCEFVETPFVHQVEKVTRKAVGFGPISWLVTGGLVGGGLAGYGAYEYTRAASIPPPGPYTSTTDPNDVRLRGALLMGSGALVFVVASVLAVVTGVQSLDSTTDLGEAPGPPSIAQRPCDPTPLSDADVALRLPGLGSPMSGRTSAVGRVVFSLVDVPSEALSPSGDRVASLTIRDQVVPVTVAEDEWRQLREALAVDPASRLARDTAEHERKKRVEAERVAAAKAAQERAEQDAKADQEEAARQAYLRKMRDCAAGKTKSPGKNSIDQLVARIVNSHTAYIPTKSFNNTQPPIVESISGPARRQLAGGGQRNIPEGTYWTVAVEYRYLGAAFGSGLRWTEAAEKYLYCDGTWEFVAACQNGECQE